jgi:hypothetical protein
MPCHGRRFNVLVMAGLAFLVMAGLVPAIPIRDALLT